MLAERGRLDPVDRHGRLMRAYAERLSREGSRHPIIAVGSTGSIAATAELIASIARLSNGAVVLPGLDRGLDPHSWSLLAGDAPTPSHPQYALRRLLDRIGIQPEEVEEIGEPSPSLAARARLISEAMRPAETTDAWGALAGTAGDPSASQELDGGFEGISVIEAQDERREALAIALVLREAIETKDLVAALSRRIAGSPSASRSSFRAGGSRPMIRPARRCRAPRRGGSRSFSPSLRARGSRPQIFSLSLPIL